MKITTKIESRKSKQGFTLIELLVVITIIGILATVGYSSYTAVTKSGRDALRKTNLEQIRSALEIYKSQNSLYPANTGCTPNGLTAGYINVYPADPVSGQSYCYQQTGAGTGYNLCARLENGGASTGVCGNSCGSNGCNYRVLNP